MRCWTTVWAVVLATGLVMGAAWAADDPAAQRGPDRPRLGPPREGVRPGEGPRPGEGLPPRGGEVRPPMPPHPLMAALDADRDGELSAEEIAKAAASLKKLDRNGDGKIDRVELRPEGLAPRPGPEQFVRNVMGQDKNGDGKVTKEEMPERMQRLLERADTNGDGAIDEAEAKAFAEKLPQGPPPGEGEGPRRPEGGRRPEGNPPPPRGEDRRGRLEPPDEK